MENTRKTDYDSAFAKKLRDLLESKSISKTELARVLGVKQQTVSQWADGSTTPKLDHLKPLASFFGISIDELVTGIAPNNEKLHFDTGLSNLALEKLKRLKSDATDNNDSSEIITEFMSVIVESMDSPIYSLARLARLCMDYIVGAHEHILWQEDVARKEKEGYEFFYHKDRPNMKNDTLDFRTYQLTKDFQYFMEHLAKNSKTWKRVKRLYEKSSLVVPDYKDQRFVEAFRSVTDWENNPYKLTAFYEEIIGSEDDEKDIPVD